jgi:glycosyltransferase involved in cell wall biosynthesis
VYVTSSEREGLSLAVVEGMAHELPCVATDIGGHDEILADTDAGVLVPPGCAEKLAGGILSVLDDPEQTRAMARAARRVAHERFNIDRMVRQIWGTLVGTRA